MEANLPDRRSLERRRDSADTYTIEGAPSRDEDEAADEDDEAASTCQDITDVFDQTLTLGSSELQSEYIYKTLRSLRMCRVHC